MHDYQREFIDFALQQEVLSFGKFKLKSGRLSPYFFNSGLFNNGKSLGQLGQFYAHAILNSGLAFDILFGPAYKGIPLVSSVSIALAQGHDKTLPYCFDRKEIKDHGEGGLTVGAPLSGRVLIVDDVISAGTSVNHSVGIIQAANARVAGVAIALDRQERGQQTRSAVQEVEQLHQIKVISIITLQNLVEYLQEQNGRHEDLERIRRYRDQYGVSQ